MLAPLTAVAQPAHAQWIPPNGMLTALPLPMPMSVPQPDVSMGRADVSVPQPAISMPLPDVSMRNALGPRQPSAAQKHRRARQQGHEFKGAAPGAPARGP